MIFWKNTNNRKAFSGPKCDITGRRHVCAALRTAMPVPPHNTFRTTAKAQAPHLTAKRWRHITNDTTNHQWLQRRSEEHTSELQSRQYLVCRLLLEKKKK